MRKAIGLLCALALLAGLFVLPGAAAGADSFYAVGGWFESIYAELSGVADADVTAVSYSGEMTGELKGDDLEYLVRDAQLASGQSGVRIDIPGLKAGKYTLTVTTKSQTYTKTGIQVEAYDRSGYAHQVMDEATGVCTRYTEGVGAYNDDGTLKDNAVVLYVTDENKDAVTLTATNSGKDFTVTGIGSILRAGSSKNQSILKRLATNNKAPLVVRLVGTVTPPKDLSTPSFYKDSNNQWDGDNAYMADMVSGANITIEGIGADAVMEGWGISFGVGSEDTQFGCGKNFEVRNLSFRNVPEDCVGIGGKSIDKDPITHTWVHNCAFYVPHIPLLQSPNTSDKPYTWVNDKQQGDGAMDWKVAKYHTMSYNYFEGYHKTNLIGGGNSQKQYHATWHHNWWKNCESRGPLCRQTDIHIYNNLYDGNTSYCMSLRASCFVFSEYNTFLKCTNPIKQDSSTTDGTGKGLCKSFNDAFINCSKDNKATIVTDRATKVTDSANYNPFINFDTTPGNYVTKEDYKLDADVEIAQANIKAYAGPMKAAEEIAESHHHDWSDWTAVADQEATCTKAGREERTCSAEGCPVGTETRAVAALGHNYESGVCTRCGDRKVAKTYTLTGDEVYAAMEQSTPTGFTKNPSTGDADGKNPNSYVAGSAVTGSTAGNFFTLYYTSGTRIDPTPKTFDDDYAAEARINFNGKAEKEKNAIGFTTTEPVTVQVWWVAGAGQDKDARSMVILKSDGKQEAAKSAESSNSTENPMFSTLKLTEAGTYYLGGDIGKNFIYKVTVTTEGAPAVEDPPGTGRLEVEGTDQTLLWTIAPDDSTPAVSDDSTISITGDVGANQTVWVACRDADGNFVSAIPLTGVDPTARLPESWANVTLMWLDAGSGPKCREARETRQP